MIVRHLLIVVAFGASMASSAMLLANDHIGYSKQIKPLLRERCFACHGALKQEGSLRLDTRDSIVRGGYSGEVISPGDASASILLERIASTDVAERMPPEHEGEPLTTDHINLIRDWIASGAPAPEDEQPEARAEDHWSFQPIVRPALPAIHNAALKNPIDVFLAQQHEQYGLQPQVEATRIVLVRRLYLDLIGIPPNGQEIAAFRDDPSPQYYEQTVNRLLDDPRHGERWSRHWMDIWRYSDWWGLGEQLRRSQKHIWHWRDWIIESLNNDTGYDEMLRLMLAADELHPNDLDRLRATGYLARNYWLFNRNQWMDETVEHVSKGILGLTMNCAKCHDHKYDPIEQTDYYRMRAFFEPYHVRLDVVPGQPDLTRDGIPRVYDGSIETPTYLYVRGEENNPDQSTAIAPGIPEIIDFEELKIQPISLPVEAWQPERRSWVIDAHVTAAKEKVKEATVAAVEAKEKWETVEKKIPAAEKEKQEKELSSVAVTTSPTDLELAESQQQLKIVEAAVDVAKTELVSVRRRAEAMRAAWTVAGDQSNDSNLASTKTERQKAVMAIRSEHVAAIATARYDVAIAELEILRAAEGKKEAAEKMMEAACKSLEEAGATAKAEVKETDQYSNLAGAEWTPTRFLFSGKDDPAIPFHPQSTGRRTALAKWITDRRNPLTARVAANHIWTRHMGTPLVATVFDFGRNGARPTHPELLDWLAAELLDNNWSMKHLHQVIVNSSAYRMSSSKSGREKNVVLDPDNHMWWRREPIRLESQLLRDSLLAHAGTLDQTIGGPPVPTSKQDASTRRSLYFFHSNNERNLFLATFDEALVTECYRRDQSVVPQQALALTNSKLVHDTAPQIAKRLSEGAEGDTHFIRKLFTVLLGIEAGDSEIAVCNKALEDWRITDAGSAENARENLVWSLINHNDFVTLR